MKHYTPEEIHYKMDWLTTLDDDELRCMLAKALSKVPTAVVDKLIDECLVLMINDVDGRYIPKNFLRKYHLILLSEQILNYDEDKRDRAILHEVAHFYLKHKMGLVDTLTPKEAKAKALIDKRFGKPLLARSTPEEDEAQENEADALVEKWLSKKR